MPGKKGKRKSHNRGGSNSLPLGVSNSHIKSLVMPKSPVDVLTEMASRVQSWPVVYNQVPNPPQPFQHPHEQRIMYTVETVIEGETSSGTGPSIDIAKNICAENAIMGIVSRKYEDLRESMEGINPEDMMNTLAIDDTPFLLASMSLFKMLNEWEADGLVLPEEVEDALYDPPSRERQTRDYFSWMGGVPSAIVPTHFYESAMPEPVEDEPKNPISLVNEMVGNIEYELVNSVQVGGITMFTMGAKYKDQLYTATEKTKKEAKKLVAIEILTKGLGLQHGENNFENA